MTNERHLIFYFYAVDGYQDNDAYKMHFACLKKYREVFDTAHFFISVDDLENKELIASVASDIVRCGFVENTEFTVIKNNEYMESGVFMDEITNKLPKLIGLTFFAHTKGVTCINKEWSNRDSILTWIFGCYYLSLNFLEELHMFTQIYQPFDQRLFFGSYLRKVLPEEGGGTKYGAEYEGTFYWVNGVALHDYLITNGLEPPRMIGRFYAERFPGDIFPIGIKVGSHGLRYYCSEAQLYTNCKDITELLLNDDEEYNEFLKEYNKTLIENGI